MTSRSGSTLDLPDMWELVYKASPVTCAITAQASIYQLWRYSYQARSLKEGLQRWAEARFGSAQPRTESLAVVLVFFVGALSPGLKIFATQHAFVTKMLCAAYLSCYVVDLWIIAIASMVTPRNGDDTLHRPSGHGSHNTSLLPSRRRALYTPALIGSLSMTLLFWLRDNRRSQSCAHAIAWMTAGMETMLIAAGFVVAAMRQSVRTWLREGWVTAIALYALAVGPICWSVQASLAEAGMQVDGSLLLFAGFCALAMFCYAVAVAASCDSGEATASRAQARFWKLAGKVAVSVLAVGFVLLHGLGAFIGYAYCYDPPDTHRPAWTSYLG